MGDTLTEYCDEKERELIAIFKKCTTEEGKDVTQKALAMVKTIKMDWGRFSGLGKNFFGN